MKNITHTYLQKSWDDSVDDVNEEDIREAVMEIQYVTEGDAAFWVGVIYDDESILEVHKNLEMVATFEDEPENELKRQCKDWPEAEKLFNLFLQGKFDAVKREFK